MKNYLDKIIHINASPEFLSNPECLKALNKLVGKVYNRKVKMIKPHIQKLIDEAKKVSSLSTEYWKLRCHYCEKAHDPTYLQDERDNCLMLWRILMQREI